ncbi:MAG: hypothetical protein DCF20_15680 [Pseudanabaena sp.]|nr:MAG: hypothetical protein DCF20_15680 [Pseudanabaena sp.]
MFFSERLNSRLSKLFVNMLHGNAGFANGSLLLTLNGVTGFNYSNINQNIFGTTPTFNFS